VNPSRKRSLDAVLLVALAAIVGIVVGHFVWSDAGSVKLSPTSSREFGPYPSEQRRSTPGGAGEAGVPRGLFGPGGNEGSGAEGEGRGSEGGSSAQGGSSNGVSAAVTSKVDPALVDINTDLGLESGAAAGTGMVVTSGGVVITNNHVITGATKITATDIGNGTTYTAKVIGYDYGRDIAVLQLEGASDLKTVTFGDSSSLKTDQNVATIGNAGGAGGTPTAAAGQITGLNQSITAGDEVDGGSERLTGLIQLSGNLQPGDSGGPLVNESGEVIGMDTAASTTFQIQSSADQGFAIPIAEVQSISGQIREGEASGTIHIGPTGLLGVFLQGGNGEQGATVENVISGTPAATSGLTAGDTITALDGKSVGSPTDLTELMLAKHPGEKVTLTYQTQAGAQQTATVTLASGPPS